MKIFIDKKYETVVMPVFGIATPFHIATIKVRRGRLQSPTFFPFDFKYLFRLLGILCNCHFPD